MLDQIRMKYEEMFNAYKMKRFSQFALFGGDKMNRSLKDIKIAPSTADGSNYLDLIKSDRLQSNFETAVTDITSAGGGIRSPKNT